MSHHTSAGEWDKDRPHRITVRTFRVCFSCATARVRCGGGVPCGRCETRSLECQYSTKRRSKTKIRNGTVQGSPAPAKDEREGHAHGQSSRLDGNHSVDLTAIVGHGTTSSEAHDRTETMRSQTLPLDPFFDQPALSTLNWCPSDLLSNTPQQQAQLEHHFHLSQYSTQTSHAARIPWQPSVTHNGQKNRVHRSTSVSATLHLSGSISGVGSSMTNTRLVYPLPMPVPCFGRSESILRVHFTSR